MSFDQTSPPPKPGEPGPGGVPYTGGERPAHEPEPADGAVPADQAVPADADEPAPTEPTPSVAELPPADGSDEAEESAPASALDDDTADEEPVELRPALEAILLVVDEPVPDVVLAQILERPTDQVTATLVELSEEYTADGRGYDLRRAAGGWRLYTRPAYAAYVERFVLDGQQTRLTQAALETLAVVAYKQPVTRARISAIRGVNCDGVIRTLLTRGLIEECGVEPEHGAHLYGTTTLFLEKLGLDGVDELPPLAPFLPTDVEALADSHEQR